MKQNEKQKAYSARMVGWARRRTLLGFLFSLVAVFVLVVVAFSVFNPEIIDFISALGISGGGATLATMAAIGNIDGVNDQYTAGRQIAYKVWLVHVNQIDEDQVYPSPNANREVGTIPLLAGEYMHYFEAIDDTLKDGSTGEKGELTTDVTNSFGFTMGGDGAKLYDFIEEYAGGRFIIIYQKCSTGDYFIAGTKCKPMILQSFERKRDTEANAVVFNFQNKSFKQPYKYVGSITRTTPETVAADATNLAIVAGKDQYQLTDNTVATAIATVSGILSSQYGNHVEVLGSGGSNPSTIADNTVFILIDGTTWTGNAGSKISFQIHDDATMVEVPGTRVQTA
ncbi:MAG: hypothetical protein KAR19_03695 [Bacteroidales bacterium]|nr:hypothetical protein [Bacteroidales bacterium]